MQTKSLDVIISEATVAIAALAALAPEARLVSLRPRDADYDLAFVAAAAASARQGYLGLWSQPPPWPVRPDQTEIHVTAAYAEDFVADHPRAQPFPGGYKTIAGQLHPGTLWLMWEMVVPGERAGMSFDGLVPIGDRWAWFPKPWRVVSPAA